MTQDRILVEGLRLKAHVGVTAKERRRRQPVEIDCEVALALQRAGRRDEVSATIDYAALTQAARQLVQGRRFRLVEAMAEALADRLLKEFKPRQVRVRIRKFSVPGAKSVGVEITRAGTSRKR